MLAGKKILIGITGSIAAYKIPLLVRELVREGAEVRVIMTPAATGFVSRLTLSTLSKSPVLTDLFEGDSWSNHVMLGRWADLFLIAPLSCNTLSKMAQGGCDNLLLATYLSATCPVVVAPAMDEDMWLHPATRINLKTIEEHGCKTMPVGYGELASGLTGEGRMAEPKEITEYISAFFSATGKLKGKKILVTAGPTYEAIDPVRFIGNHSSGKMGFALAEAFAAEGAAVTLISGPVHLQPKDRNIRLVSVTTAEEMYQASTREKDYDVAVMAAAVADYTPQRPSSEKIKKSNGAFHLELKPTTDILATMGREKKDGQLVVGFALETENEKENASKKLRDKKADMIVLNSLRDEGAGFGKDTNKVSLFKKDGSILELDMKSKSSVAADIVAAIIEMMP